MAYKPVIAGGVQVPAGGSGSSFTNISATGLRTWGGTKVTTASAMAALEIDVTKAMNTKSVNADTTFTFSGTPANSNQWFGMQVTNGGTQRTLTIPSSFSISRGGAITSIIIPANAKFYLVWCYDGSVYNLFGDPPLVSGTGSFALTTNPVFVGPTLGTIQSGSVLGAGTVDGTNLVGFRGAPQNSQSDDYTTVAADAGKCIFHPAADTNDRSFTIDSEANVNYPIGTIMEFLNMSPNDVTVGVADDAMTWLPSGASGSRTLAEYGRASVEKIASASWVISGNSALT